MLEAGMERARGHLERVQANDDAQIAKSDLDQVLSLDQSLAGMKKKAADDKADFKAATAQIKASHAEIAVLKQHAAKVAKQIKALRGTAAALVAKATHTREEEARAKDKADVAREQLSSALVHRARRRAAVCSPLVYLLPVLPHDASACSPPPSTLAHAAARGSCKKGGRSW
jgi:septal ring factor EnvC (AmiA/AmiB activator)